MKDFNHNVRNLFYTIQGMTDSHLLQADEGRFRSLAERLMHAEETLKHARSQSERGLDLIRRLSQLLIQKQKMVTPENPEDRSSFLKPVFEEVQALLNKEYPKAKVSWKVWIPENLPKVLCQEEDLREILYNLFRNAFHALGFCGEVSFLAQTGVSREGETQAVIEILDTGTGMPPSVLHQIFHPFFTTKSVEDGNGLGLFLTRELVLKNHGDIFVSSREKEGTLVRLIFGIQPSDSKAPIEKSSGDIRPQ